MILSRALDIKVVLSEKIDKLAELASSFNNSLTELEEEKKNRMSSHQTIPQRTLPPIAQSGTHQYVRTSFPSSRPVSASTNKSFKSTRGLYLNAEPTP